MRVGRGARARVVLEHTRVGEARERAAEQDPPGRGVDDLVVDVGVLPGDGEVPGQAIAGRVGERHEARVVAVGERGRPLAAGLLLGGGVEPRGAEVVLGDRESLAGREAGLGARDVQRVQGAPVTLTMRPSAATLALSVLSYAGRPSLVCCHVTWVTPSLER